MVKWMDKQNHLRPSLLINWVVLELLKHEDFSSREEVECFYFYCHIWKLLKLEDFQHQHRTPHFSLYVRLFTCLEGSIAAQMILCSCVPINSAYLTWLREAGRRRVLSRRPPIKRDSNSEEVMALTDWTFLPQKLGLSVKRLFS